MTTLTPQQYNGFEAAARRTAPHLAQMAFAPSTFLELSCPVEASDEADLLRFADSMHEMSGANYFKSPFTVSPDEADLLRRVTDHVADFTETAFGRRLRPWTAPISAIEMFRVVTALARLQGKHKIRVLEIGPGSGYLGALLLMAGHQVMAMDNTQAFYLWQNRLWGSLAGENGLLELADPALPLAADPAKSVIHLPWWRFAQLHEGNPFAVDFVICDHALNEISTLALRYILRQCLPMLERDGMFLFCHAGHAQKRNEESLFAEFARAGYDPLFKRLFYAFAPPGGPQAGLAIPHDAMGRAPLSKRAKVILKRKTGAEAIKPFLALDKAIPAFDPSNTGKRLPVIDVLPYRPGEMSVEYPFAAAAGFYVPPPGRDR